MMGFKLTAADYAEYIKRAYALIHDKGDYVTELDLATGDGDHWSNINMGFESLVKDIDSLAAMNISDELKEIGKIMMSVIGGSSGVLYGSAYLAAARAVQTKEALGRQELYDVLEAMLRAIASRGQAKEGFKTMLDSLAPAVKEYKVCLEHNCDDQTLCERVKKAAVDGAENTKNMEAVRGRATYQANKGVGHLDPGAVTMSYQIIALMDYVAETL
ncbi:dihydroxyacetone kinase subunit DhaL [Clostridium sp.]|uniref:dihydroxyacetone kinase subunit DhaL n=1 Tax=Clostridium sp. TaxID=1506 RepID=UPI00338E267E